MTRFRSQHRAFTLIEILIVVVILGILAAIVIPQFSNASALARETTLRDELRYLRSQIQLYRAQHDNIVPGYPDGNTAAGASVDAFVNQLTQYTDTFGRVATTSSLQYRYGKYLSQMPANPLNSLASIKLDSGTTTPTPDGSTGWIYQPLTGNVWPNLSTSDNSGKRYFDY
jgi:general secretion pathway protein G